MFLVANDSLSSVFSRVKERMKKSLLYNPFWRAIAEVFFTLLFTFTPFLLLSIPFTPSAGDLSGDAVRSKFWAFWDAGELVLPILGLAGALVSLAALNNRALGGVLNFFTLFLAFGFAAAGWFVLSETKGFSEAIHPPIVWVGFFGYGFMLFVWGFVSFRVHEFNLTDVVDRENPEERADLLNKQKAAAKSVGAK